MPRARLQAAVTRHPLVVRGRMFQDGELVPSGVGVDPEAGTITAVGRHLEGDEVIDQGDGILLPGAVDVHVHLRDPGHPHKEDFESGTRAALSGGVTTVFDMPNTDPATTTLAAYEQKQAVAGAKAVADWGLWGGTTGDVEETLRVARVAPGIKVYLGESTGQVLMQNGDRLGDVVKRLKEADYAGVLAFHAEAQRVLEQAAGGSLEPGLAGHAARRPPQAELEALAGIRAAVGPAGTALPLRVHVAHVSTLALLQAAHAEGYSCGVTPHHLLLDHTVALGSFGRVNPPLREPREREGLFKAFAQGGIPVLESDHAPHTREEKDREVPEAPSGMPGVETLVPVLLAHALRPFPGRPRLAPERLMEAVSAAPARLFALNKGRLAPGLDADLVVVHPEDRAPLVPEDRVTRCGWSPFTGWPAVFPRSVWLRGRQVVQEGEVVARPGSGRQVPAASRQVSGREE